MHLADLDREEMEVYRTEYPAWYRLARQSSEETRAWRRERREEWAHLVARRLELVRLTFLLRTLTPLQSVSLMRHPSRKAS